MQTCNFSYIPHLMSVGCGAMIIIIKELNKEKGGALVSQCALK